MIPVDLCAAEQIQSPGCIQPPFALFCLHSATLAELATTTNVGEVLRAAGAVVAVSSTSLRLAVSHGPWDLWPTRERWEASVMADQAERLPHQVEEFVAQIQ